MPFNNYVPQNNAQWQILAGISAGATTVILQSGQGGRFPSIFPYLCELKNVDTVAPYAVLKRELVKVTGRSGDTLTIVRSAGTCLPSDASNTPGTTAFAFSSNDTITLTVTAETIKDIQDEVSLKLATAGGVRTWLANNSILTTNASGNEVLLAPTAWHVVWFTGWGVPTTFAPTVDINGTTAETALASTDAFIFYDASASANRKILLQELLKNISKSVFPSISNEIQCSSDSVVSTIGSAFTERKSIQLLTDRSGWVRISYDMRVISGSMGSRLYLNWNWIVPSAQTTTSTSFVTFTYDIASINAGDTVALWTNNDPWTWECRNFRMLFTMNFENFATVLI